MPPPPPDRLERYRAKRTPGRTPEPFGGEAVPGAAPSGRLYVFHKHHARNLHWDLRLELDGALESWAVPKGPSPNPADKRLAMHVEPHPLDYADFEGVIPSGEYGAGPSIVWDRGVWIPLDDPHEGLAKGKLLFELRGFKVRGVWTLVHTPRAGENHWLLIKETGDAWADPGGATGDYPDESIYSGLPVDELPRARDRAEELAGRADRAGAERRALRAGEVEPTKATRWEAPFSDPGWVFEIKYDGYRVVAGREGGEATLVSRNGNDLTATFPEIARAVAGLPYEGLVLDGEVVVHDERGLPSFGRLQKRGRLQNRRDIARATLELPATYYAFDLLGLEGRDLRSLPLLERKRLLEQLLPTAGPMRYSEHVPGRGEAVFERVEALGLEGMVAKKADGPYPGGRTDLWRKIRTVRTDDFVVVGYTDPRGSRVGFGALHLGLWEGGRLVWMGSVGTGFSDAVLRDLTPRLEALERARDEAEAGDGEGVSPPELVAPEGSELPRGRGQHWILPELVVEVQYREVTAAGVLRHASFQRVRDDKPPGECRLDEGEVPGAAVLPEPLDAGEVEGAEKTVPFTNLDKVYWPAEDQPAEGEGPDRPEGAPPGSRTKGDMIRYYEAIAPWLLPYLADRPLVLTRFPDGIRGKSFYQKDAPVWAPDWIRTVTVRSAGAGSGGDPGGAEKELNYFVAEDLETLLYLANLGTIPLHVWHSRAATLDRPDWCLLDLDPKDAPFRWVVEVARHLHGLLDDLALPHYVKTTGSTGLHVLVPLGRLTTWDQSRALGELLANLAVKALPDLATVERVVRKRAGKVYVDFLQNRRGQLMAAPFCVRARPWATVSAPLHWDEVDEGLDLRDYRMDNVPARMEALGEDPLRPVLEQAPDLLGALERLKERVE